MPRVVHFAPGSFGAWLQTKGHAQSFNDLPTAYRTTARRLHAGDTAPNSPMLVRLADELDEPLATLQGFATAPPMSPKWVLKVENQLASGHGYGGGPRRGKRTAARKTRKTPHASRRGNPRRNPLTQLLVERSGLSVDALGRRLGISTGTMTRLGGGQLAANHPLLPPVAKALGVDLKTLTQFMHGPRLSKAGVKAVLAKLGTGAAKRRAADAAAPGTAVVHVPRDAKPAAKPAKRPYNKLRSTALTLREAARSMLMSLNVAIMRGEDTMPPMPVRALHLVLVDYLEAKGVRGNVLVDPDFATIFDPK